LDGGPICHYTVEKMNNEKTSAFLCTPYPAFEVTVWTCTTIGYPQEQPAKAQGLLTFPPQLCPGSAPDDMGQQRMG